MGIRLCLNSGYLNTCSSPLLPSNAPCTCIDLSHVVLPRQILQDATCHLALRMSAEGLWWPTLEVMRMTLGSCKTSYIYILYMIWIYTCEGGERKPARVFSVKPARKMISNIDYPIISHLSNMPTFFWAKTRQIRGADTPRGRNVPGKEAGQRQTKWHTVWCAISICHTWPRR